MNHSNTILETIGAEAMEKLIQKFGGRKIYVPKVMPDSHYEEKIIHIFSESLKDGATCMNAYR